MGQRPSADLFFGYVFNECDTYPWQGDDYDYDSEEHAMKEEWDDNMHVLNAYGFSAEAIDAMSYGDMKAELEKIGVTLCSWGCLYDSSSYYIRPLDPESYYGTDWDSSQHIPTDALKDNDTYLAWTKDLEEFAKKLGIDLEGQVPGWHLVASFG